ncbi:glyoxalase [Zafaria cholistanensis]|uniref:Glyoxalase n=1 Tax=Zafaria cholistanensis TaxID=1682741 RepID=A0A5A7NPC6_9MICC|nr:VOC family protein [Zafaria cholistanensis]GER22012.1 glyoxalase [Zafaria cholistanensis]
MPIRNEPWPTGTPCWVDLQSDDVPAACAFYARLFGWTFEQAPEGAGGYTFALLDGRKAAGIGPRPEDPEGPPAWITHLAADNADQVAAWIAAAGGIIMVPAFDVMEAGRMLVAADSAGAVFGVWQARDSFGAEVHGERGALCWNELHTRDFDGSKDFYARVFGYTYDTVSDTEEFRYAQFRPVGAKEAFGAVFEDARSLSGAPNYWLPWFAVGDVDGVSDTAAELGARALMPPADSDYGRMAVLAGPEGELFGIIDPVMPAGTA